MKLNFTGHSGMTARSVWCLGRNYADHALELGNPVEATPLVFQKGLNALKPLEGTQILPRGKGKIHFETELVLCIVRTSAGAKITGIAVGLDLTLRELQHELKMEGKPWALAKSFDGAGILSSFYPMSSYPDLNNIEFSMKLNGEVAQRGNSRDMLLPIPEILEYLATFTALDTGDLIFTGTPRGVGEINTGDEVELFLSETRLGKITFI
jgi:2-keto-4-pentenoate hydratase/2-oxohepta-3-ene-1,7-dioic acid hydratase in catechol pathway